MNIELLQQLCEASAVSGDEQEVRDILINTLEPCVNEITFDGLGSFVARKGNKGPKVAVVGHMDEVGFMVTHIDESGFLRFTTIGGWWNQSMLNHRVTIRTHKGYKIVVATAPSLDAGEYARHIPERMLADGNATIVSGKTYDVLAEASAALVTSGTATLETALFYVPQVVCYYTAAGRFVSFLRKHLLHVPYISLVNLIAGREVVKELVADGMTVENIRRELGNIIEDVHKRNAMLNGYRHMAKILGDPGAADNAARQMTECLKRYDNDK